MFRRIAIKLFIFQFRVYVFIKSLTKEYLPNSIYEYVFIKPTIQYNGRDNQARRIDGAVQKIPRKESPETRGWRRETGSSYESFTSKGEGITRSQSVNDIQGMFKASI
jgi:hypothetical protein